MDSSSNWSKNVPSKLPQWEGEAATLCALDSSLHPFMPHSNVAGTSRITRLSPPSNDRPTVCASYTLHRFVNIFRANSIQTCKQACRALLAVVEKCNKCCEVDLLIWIQFKRCTISSLVTKILHFTINLTFINLWFIVACLYNACMRCTLC